MWRYLVFANYSWLATSYYLFFSKYWRTKQSNLTIGMHRGLCKDILYLIGPILFCHVDLRNLETIPWLCPLLDPKSNQDDPTNVDFKIENPTNWCEIALRPWAMDSHKFLKHFEPIWKRVFYIYIYIYIYTHIYIYI